MTQTFTGHAFEYLEKMHSWRKYFIDRADKPFEREDTIFTSCSPSSGGNNSWGQTSSSQWGPGFQQWDTPPNAQQWGPPPNAQQWGTPPNSQQWNSPPIAPQWGSSSNPQQWGSSPNSSQWTPQMNIQHGFPKETRHETTRTSPERVSAEVSMPNPTNMARGVSPEFGLANYASTEQISRPRKVGGLFNIWGTKQD
ncbi:unnamed protein product [Microthlaspi erraticum]|uniref:Uncharacterized protein n=1 Tax=Microthlaspi erraticum TaxID=1685480 RepID=A0A6D2IHJ9_9BRAS|nr:unnamed protein product [Microthlaspi erraticum]